MPMQVTYQHVPAAVSRVSAYEWRAGSRPEPLVVSSTRHADQMIVTFEVRTQAIVLLQRGDATYVIDGPIARSGSAEREFAAVWRRSVSGTSITGVPGAPEITWVTEHGVGGDAWPRCWWESAAQWECFGVPVDAAGVAVAITDTVYAAPVAAGSMPVMRGSRWGRLVTVSSGDGPPTELRIAAARPVAPTAARTTGVRLETAALVDMRVLTLRSGLVWIAGDSSPPAAWVELRAPGEGPVYQRVADLASGSPLVPLRIDLVDARSVDVAVVPAAAQVVGETLITTYRLIDAPPRTDARDPPPRRVFVAETLTGADGRARIDGLGEADYEIVAWHPRLGRAAMLLPAGRASVTIHLQSPGIVRGRVLAGGKPAAGVDVISVPDPAAYAAALDPLEVKGGDARTSADGRFSVALASGGGGELRIGGSSYAVTRVPLPRAPLPIVELGDIELSRPIAVTVALDQDMPCDVQAAGPIGRAGLQIVKASRTGPGLYAMTMTEEGSWAFVLLCGRTEQTVIPSIVDISARDAGRQIRLLVR